MKTPPTIMPTTPPQTPIHLGYPAEPLPPRIPPVRRRAPYRPIILVMIAGFLTALLICLIVGAILPSKLQINLPGQNSPVLTIRPSTPGEKVLLFMGVDHSDPSHPENPSFDGARTDTMMLVRVSSRNHSISVVSIPRDSKVNLANARGSVDKINAAHALGGPELSVATVEKAFGVPVDNYMVVNLDGVDDVIDALGGIDIYVDKPMHYVDHTAKLNINFEPGQYHLNGKQAEEFLRFRHDELGDIGRIRRQQQFVMAVMKKLKDPWSLTKIPGVLNIASKFIKTDMSLPEIAQLASFAPGIHFENLRTATLPGRASGGYISYWLVDPEAAEAVLNRLILDAGDDATNGVDYTQPLRVGILYTPEFQAKLPELESHLNQQKFVVSCRMPYRRASTQIVEHSGRTSSSLSRQLQESDASLNAARLVFAPSGTTYEVMTCGAREDYTIMIGTDVATAAHP